MGRHIIQKWNEFTIELVIEKTIAMVEIVDWWSRITIAMVEIIDWLLRVTIAMVQKRRLNIENTIAMVETKIGDEKWWLKGSKISSVDWWLKMSTAGIENINWQFRAEKDWKQAKDNTPMLTWISIPRIHFRRGRPPTTVIVVIQRNF